MGSLLGWHRDVRGPLPSAGGTQQCRAVCWAPAATNCSLGSRMAFPSSLVTPASLSPQAQRCHLSSRAGTVVPVQARSSDSSSSFLICVHGHLFREACSCLNRKFQGWIQHYGTCCFSEDYCPGATTNSGSFDGELCTLPIKKGIKQFLSLDG